MATTYYAQIALKLDKNIGPIPENSTIEVRPRSTIGLKYVELDARRLEERHCPTAERCRSVRRGSPPSSKTCSNTFDERVREGNKQFAAGVRQRVRRARQQT